MNWYFGVLKKFAVFEGRARRSEYWYFHLFNIIAVVLLMVIESIIGSKGILVGIYTLAILIPSLAVSVRRLHDTGRSGWWLFISVVPVIGAIAVLVFTLQDGYSGANQYGQNPKGSYFAPAEQYRRDPIPDTKIFCNKCGTQLIITSGYCTKCGAPIAQL